jgi:hypothetical protein
VTGAGDGKFWLAGFEELYPDSCDPVSKQLIFTVLDDLEDREAAYVKRRVGICLLRLQHIEHGAASK